MLLKKLVVVAGLSFLFFATLLNADTGETVDNRTLVADAFEAWRQGQGSPFDLLAQNATWTIAGPTSSAGTYTRDELIEKVIKPFSARLKTPLVPSVNHIYQDGETVIILFDANATLINEQPYKNSYAWFFTIRGGRVDHVTAVLDLHAFDEVMALAD